MDWYDDPSIAKDLATFDAHYGLAKETATSFRKVNQNGKTSPLPHAYPAGSPDNTSTEIALDVQTVRAVCHTCRILLVEASSPSDANIAAAENRAVSMGAGVVSNSFGEPEKLASSTLQKAFVHPGVVITASSGDDGWWGWDSVNDPDDDPFYAYPGASYPAADSRVVAVGGTTLNLTAGGTRASEYVWNGDDPEDAATLKQQVVLGASGGGCSARFTAPAWQTTYPGYKATGCNGKRLATDIAADADPLTGLDIVDSHWPESGNKAGWQTIGGTSLSAPLVAAMFALDGGSHGARYPAASLYANGTRRASTLYDVKTGGNGYCGGDTTAHCMTVSAASSFTGKSANPNAQLGPVDCSFPLSASEPTTAPAASPQCNAVTGFDGPSGLGTPKSLTFFTHTNPTLSISRLSALKLRSSTTFRANLVEPLSGVKATGYSWNWGDGKTTAAGTATTARHAYTRAGRYTVTLSATDTLHQNQIVQVAVTVGEHAKVSYRGATKVRRKTSHLFSARGTTTPNSGAKIAHITWLWGDRTKVGHGWSAHHTYKKAGTRTITINIYDSTGVKTVVKKRVKVTS